MRWLTPPAGSYNWAPTCWVPLTMNPTKRVLVPQRLRSVPAQFSWIDQRLVREGFLTRCDPPAAALYLFLVTVADARGLSYYGDASVLRCLSLTPAQLESARERLIAADLIAFAAPLYQVLSLPGTPGRPSGSHALPRAEARAQLERLCQQLRRRHG